MRAVLAVGALTLQGCFSAVDPGDGCLSPEAFRAVDMTGVWNGRIRDEIAVQFELVQLPPTISPGNPAELSGTVSVTIPGPVEVTGPVAGKTKALTCGSSNEPSKQSLNLQAVLSVKPDDHLDLSLTLDFVGSFGRPLLGVGEIEGPLRFSGPTSFTFDLDGDVVGLELGAFTDVFFALARQR